MDATTRLVAWMLALVVAGWSAGAGADDPAGTAAKGIDKLAWDLVRAGGVGNTIVSPASVWEAIAMTHQGARGETAAEIAGVLGMPDDREAIAASAEALRSAWREARGTAITLDVANRLWIERGQPLDPPFTDTLQRRFNAEVGIVDFSRAPDAARAEINAWVADHTARKITDLLKEGSITSLTRLVITNAVFLKAPWATPFATKATRPDPFTLTADTSISVPFMHRSDRLLAGRVGEGDDAVTVCEIPYEGHRMAMVIMVPARVGALPDVVRRLDGDWRTTWAGGGGAVRNRPVVLSLPKWTARKPLDLGDALKSLGMRQAFTPDTADLSGIDGTRTLFVSSVVHEGFVDVSEEGTEAAAATGVVVGVRSAAPSRDEPFEVKADRPFAWAIVDRTTGAVLFAGTVVDPRG